MLGGQCVEVLPPPSEGVFLASPVESMATAGGRRSGSGPHRGGGGGRNFNSNSRFRGRGGGGGFVARQSEETGGQVSAVQEAPPTPSVVLGSHRVLGQVPHEERLKDLSPEGRDWVAKLTPVLETYDYDTNDVLELLAHCEHDPIRIQNAVDAILEEKRGHELGGWTVQTSKRQSNQEKKMTQQKQQLQQQQQQQQKYKKYNSGGQPRAPTNGENQAPPPLSRSVRPTEAKYVQHPPQQEGPALQMRKGSSGVRVAGVTRPTATVPAPPPPTPLFPPHAPPQVARAGPSGVPLAEKQRQSSAGEASQTVRQVSSQGSLPGTRQPDAVQQQHYFHNPKQQSQGAGTPPVPPRQERPRMQQQSAFVAGGGGRGGGRSARQAWNSRFREGVRPPTPPMSDGGIPPPPPLPQQQMHNVIVAPALIPSQAPPPPPVSQPTPETHPPAQKPTATWASVVKQKQQPAAPVSAALAAASGPQVVLSNSTGASGVKSATRSTVVSNNSSFETGLIPSRVPDGSRGRSQSGNSSYASAGERLEKSSAGAAASGSHIATLAYSSVDAASPVLSSRAGGSYVGAELGQISSRGGADEEEPQESLGEGVVPREGRDPEDQTIYNRPAAVSSNFQQEGGRESSSVLPDQPYEEDEGVAHQSASTSDQMQQNLQQYACYRPSAQQHGAPSKLNGRPPVTVVVVEDGVILPVSAATATSSPCVDVVMPPGQNVPLPSGPAAAIVAPRLGVDATAQQQQQQAPPPPSQQTPGHKEVGTNVAAGRDASTTSTRYIATVGGGESKRGGGAVLPRGPQVVTGVVNSKVVCFGTLRNTSDSDDRTEAERSAPNNDSGARSSYADQDSIGGAQQVCEAGAMEPVTNTTPQSATGIRFGAFRQTPDSSTLDMMYCSPDSYEQMSSAGRGGRVAIQHQQHVAAPPTAVDDEEAVRGEMAAMAMRPRTQQKFTQTMTHGTQTTVPRSYPEYEQPQQQQMYYSEQAPLQQQQRLADTAAYAQMVLHQQRRPGVQQAPPRPQASTVPETLQRAGPPRLANNVSSLVSKNGGSYGLSEPKYRIVKNTGAAAAENVRGSLSVSVPSPRDTEGDGAAHPDTSLGRPSLGVAKTVQRNSVEKHQERTRPLQVYTSAAAAAVRQARQQQQQQQQQQALLRSQQQQQQQQEAYTNVADGHYAYQGGAYIGTAGAQQQGEDYTPTEAQQPGFYAYDNATAQQQQELQQQQQQHQQQQQMQSQPQEQASSYAGYSSHYGNENRARGSRMYYYNNNSNNSFPEGGSTNTYPKRGGGYYHNRSSYYNRNNNNNNVQGNAENASNVQSADSGYPSHKNAFNASASPTEASAAAAAAAAPQHHMHAYGARYHNYKQQQQHQSGPAGGRGSYSSYYSNKQQQQYYGDNDGAYSGASKYDMYARASTDARNNTDYAAASHAQNEGATLSQPAECNVRGTTLTQSPAGQATTMMASSELMQPSSGDPLGAAAVQQQQLVHGGYTHAAPAAYYAAHLTTAAATAASANPQTHPQYRDYYGYSQQRAALYAAQQAGLYGYSSLSMPAEGSAQQACYGLHASDAATAPETKAGNSAAASLAGQQASHYSGTLHQTARGLAANDGSGVAAMHYATAAPTTATTTVADLAGNAADLDPSNAAMMSMFVPAAPSQPTHYADNGSNAHMRTGALTSTSSSAGAQQQYALYAEAAANYGLYDPAAFAAAAAASHQASPPTDSVYAADSAAGVAAGAAQSRGAGTSASHNSVNNPTGSTGAIATANIPSHSAAAAAMMASRAAYQLNSAAASNAAAAAGLVLVETAAANGAGGANTDARHSASYATSNNAYNTLLHQVHLNYALQQQAASQATYHQHYARQ